MTKFSDIEQKILPFFEKYPILVRSAERGAVKSKDFLDLSKIAGLMKNKEHLTFEGLNKIRQIQSNMNSKRTTYI